MKLPTNENYCGQGRLLKEAAEEITFSQNMISLEQPRPEFHPEAAQNSKKPLLWAGAAAEVGKIAFPPPPVPRTRNTTSCEPLRGLIQESSHWGRGGEVAFPPPPPSWALLRTSERLLFPTRRPLHPEEKPAGHKQEVAMIITSGARGAPRIPNSYPQRPPANWDQVSKTTTAKSQLGIHKPPFQAESSQIV